MPLRVLCPCDPAVVLPACERREPTVVGGRQAWICDGGLLVIANDDSLIVYTPDEAAGIIESELAELGDTVW